MILTIPTLHQFVSGFPELHVQLKEFIKSKNQDYYDARDDDLVEQLKRNKIDIDKLIRDKERQYKEEILEYADRVGPTDEEIFAQSFHRYDAYL